MIEIDPQFVVKFFVALTARLEAGKLTTTTYYAQISAKVEAFYKTVCTRSWLRHRYSD